MMGLLTLIVFVASITMPIAVAVASYRLAQRLRHGWALHLLFVPVLVMCEWAAITLLGITVGDNGDGPPGEVFLYAPAFLTLIITVFIYYGSLATMSLIRVIKGRRFVR